MVTLPSSLNGSPPAFRRPVFQVSFGSGSAEDWARALIALRVEAALAPFVDAAEILFSAASDAPNIAVGDSGSIALGYQDGSTDLVFTGHVEAVQHSVRGVTRVTATNGAASLARLRVNRSYEEQTAGEILSDLAGEAGVSTGSVESGISFPYYVVDDRRTAHQHVAALAAKSGYLAYLTPEGDLSFVPLASAAPVQVFTYGQDILSLEAAEASPQAGAVTVIGEGTAGSQGKEAWNWLIKDPQEVTGSAGQGAPERRVVDSSVRSGEAAQTAADGAAGLAGLLDLTGTLLVPGAPLAVVGSFVEVAGAPRDALNGPCLVRWVRHHYSKDAGFTSTIRFGKVGGNGLGGLL